MQKIKIRASISEGDIKANTDIFSGDITPTFPLAYFRIYATFDKAGVLNVCRSFDGRKPITEKLNSGESLKANTAYVFEIVVEKGETKVETINLQYSVDAIALVLKVIEIDFEVGSRI